MSTEHRVPSLLSSVIKQQRWPHTLDSCPGAPPSTVSHTQVALIAASQAPAPGTTPGSGVWDELGNHTAELEQNWDQLRLLSHRATEKPPPRPPPLCSHPARWQLVQALSGHTGPMPGSQVSGIAMATWVTEGAALTDRGLSPGTTSAW